MLDNKKLEDLRSVLNDLGFSDKDKAMKVEVERAFLENPTKNTLFNLYKLNEENVKVGSFIKYMVAVYSFIEKNNLQITARELVIVANEKFTEQMQDAIRNRRILNACGKERAQ